MVTVDTVAQEAYYGIILFLAEDYGEDDPEAGNCRVFFSFYGCGGTDPCDVCPGRHRFFKTC
ncbi:MAG: hypothetical protein ACUZ8A_08050, partial [Candidatus Bathyanammoxibius sp.]